ncbi:hypothetical protein D9M68_748290 [compost metagenome]
MLFGLQVGFCLHTRGDGVLLSHQQATHLQQLIGLLAGQLVGIADGLHLTGSALSLALQLLQGVGVVLQRGLLLIQATE